MTTIRLHGLAASRTLRVIWMLNELGLPYEHDPISFSDERLRQAPFTDINPNGRIPALEVDGFAIYESMAINLYLADRFGGALAPASAEERGLATQWSFWVMTEIERDITTWVVNARLKPEGERDPAAAQAALAALQRPLQALETSLKGRAYLVGDRFTVADLNVAAVMYRGLLMDLAAYPGVCAGLQRCWSREAALVARRARGDQV